MADMTVLHFASPFAFSAPVVESRLSKPASDDQDGTRQRTYQADPDPTTTHANTARENGIVDARDARSTLISAVDLTPALNDVSGVSASVDTVLAAYQQDASLMDGTDHPAP